MVRILCCNGTIGWYISYVRINRTEVMYQLQYLNGSTVVESFNFYNKALCLWKKKQLLNQGTHKSGVFKIKSL